MFEIVNYETKFIDSLSTKRLLGILIQAATPTLAQYSSSHGGAAMHCNQSDFVLNKNISTLMNRMAQDTGPKTWCMFQCVPAHCKFWTKPCGVENAWNNGFRGECNKAKNWTCQFACLVVACMPASQHTTWFQQFCKCSIMHLRKPKQTE